MTENKIFIFFNIFLLSGIFINNILENITTSLLVLLFLVVLFLLFNFITKKYLILTIFILIGFLSGIIISDYNINKINNNFKKINIYLNTEKYNIIYEIKEISKIDNEKIIYKAKVLKLDNYVLENNIFTEIHIKNLDKLDKGTILQSKEKLYKIKNSPEFQYKNYMLSKGVYFKFFPYSYKVVDKIEINPLESKIISFRTNFLDTIHNIYTKDEAIFLGGILLGAREEINKDLKTNFNNSGLTHFIAVSGFNITILLIFFGIFLKYFPGYIKIIGMTIFIIIFVMLVGDTAPVIRAALMGLVGYYIVTFGRQGNSLSILLLTASLMIIYSPYSLNYDVSMHLSFLAVLGILYTQKFFEKVFYFIPNILEIRTAFTLTLSALSFSLPVIMFNFGQISILSPLANILVTWTIPLAMILGFLSVIVYFLFPLGGIVIGYFTWILLKWDILIVNTFGESSWAVLKTDFGQYKNYYEVIYFVILIFIILWFRKREDKN